MSYEIFAHHAHLFPQDERPNGTLSVLLKHMDECGIARSVAFAPMPPHTALEDSNAWLAREIAAAHGRVIGFGAVNMQRDNMEEQVRHIWELGLRGIKMHPAYQRFDLMGEKARRVYAEAERLNLPISFHTGIHWYRISAYNMLLYDEIAYHYPALRFSMEHVGGYAFFNEGVAVMVNNAHKCMPYAGMTSVCDRGKNKFWYLSDEQIQDLCWQTDDAHMIFGLDFPYNDAEKTKVAIERFKRLFPQEDTQRRIFGENLRHFIGEE